MREMESISIDLLDRAQFITRIVQCVEVLAKQKKSSCFAINGSWGAGKTYVLDKLADTLKENSGLEDAAQFVIIRYNCWEYDYYDEPLLSMVASILDDIEKLGINATTKATIKNSLLYAGNILISGAVSYFDTITNGRATAIKEAIDSVREGTKTDIANRTAFDGNLPFQKSIKSLRKCLKSLAGNQTVVILVDELDRCLPEYSIRVLERLHHLFDGIDNTQIIFSVDRNQLSHAVKQIYGPNADTVAYLRKFISFEYKLDIGTINNRFDNKFYDYVSLFSPCSGEELVETNTLKTSLLDGFDIRNRIALVERANLVHQLTWKSEELPPMRYLCLELFLTVVNTIQNFQCLQIHFDAEANLLDLGCWIIGPKSTDVLQQKPAWLSLMADTICGNLDTYGFPFFRMNYGVIEINTRSVMGFILSVIHSLWADPSSDPYQIVCISPNDSGNKETDLNKQIIYAREFMEYTSSMGL